MKRIPLVSVVMAVHNGDTYLRQAIDSILFQTFEDLEFIIVDDGSTDACASIIQSYAGKDLRIRLISHSNRGLAQSLNVGISAASGKFIARMDGDDISLPERIERQVRWLDGHPECVLLGTGTLRVDSDGDPLGVVFQWSDHDRIYRECLLGNGTALVHPSIMTRRAALDLIGGYNPAFLTTQDLDLYLRLCEVGTAHNLPEVLLHWRQHEGTVSHAQHQSWVAFKAMAVGAAMERQGVESCLRVIFDDSRENVMNFSLEERSFLHAMSGGNLRTAFKHYVRKVRKQGMCRRDWRHAAMYFKWLIDSDRQSRR